MVNNLNDRINCETGELNPPIGMAGAGHEDSEEAATGGTAFTKEFGRGFKAGRESAQKIERAEPSRGAQRAARKVWAIGYVGEPPKPAPADKVEILEAAKIIDRETGHVVLLEALKHALPILISAIAFVDCKAVVAEVRAAIQQAERT